jgi:hypothetical protein
MASLQNRAARLFSKAGIPLWVFRFHVVGLSGKSRFGGGKLRVLYAGTKPFLEYFKGSAFDEPPREELLGVHNITDLGDVRQCDEWDLALFRGHANYARLGFFPRAFFVPEWVAGTASLAQQQAYEKTSRSRKRDRALLDRKGVTHRVTRDGGDLDFFYEHMYLPYVSTRHGQSAFLVQRDEMMARVAASDGRLVQILVDGEPVAGSLIIVENGRPRLYSLGVLEDDRPLMRYGVGTAIYLYSYDHLVESGFTDVHMGWSRSLLSDGTLYFKQRLGLRLMDTSPIGHFLLPGHRSEAARQFLGQTGFLHRRRGPIRAILFKSDALERQDKYFSRRNMQCQSMGVKHIDVVDLDSPGVQPPIGLGKVKTG